MLHALILNKIGSSLSPAFRSRFWFSNINKKKQTITTIGIPMNKPKQNNHKQTKSEGDSNVEKKVTNEPKQETKMETDEKEKESEISESSVTSPKMQGIQQTVALSPAQFIQNVGSQTMISDADEVNKKVDDIEMFMASDGKMDDDALQEWDCDDYDDTDIAMAGDMDDNQANDTDLDLTIVGKKLSYLFDAVPVGNTDHIDNTDNNHNDFAGNYLKGSNYWELDKDTKQSKNEENKEVEENFDDLAKALYIPQPFNGLDIKKESEWEVCLNNNKDNVNGLLIIELYSEIFGPSNVMYSMIDEILVNKRKELENKNNDNKIEFVRLSSEKLNEINVIKEVINDYECYISTPIPTYIFIKCGQKIDTLKGTQPTEFERLLDKYLENQDENEELFASDSFMTDPLMPRIKYKSILKERPKTSYLMSTINLINNDKENKPQNSNVENIRNLIKNMDISSNQTTRLSKRNKSTSTSTSTSTSWNNVYV